MKQNSFSLAKEACWCVTTLTEQAKVSPLLNNPLVPHVHIQESIKWMDVKLFFSLKVNIVPPKKYLLALDHSPKVDYSFSFCFLSRPNFVSIAWRTLFTVQKIIYFELASSYTHILHEFHRNRCANLSYLIHAYRLSLSVYNQNLRNHFWRPCSWSNSSNLFEFIYLWKCINYFS